MVKAERTIRGRVQGTLGLFGVVALLVTAALVTGWNPLPGWAAWLSRLTAIASPEPAWSVRLDGQPRQVTLADDAVIVVRDDAVESRDLRTGQQNWRRGARWGAVAGTVGSASLVTVVGQARGYEVLDSGTGATRWKGEKDATSVWTYTDLILALVCPDLDGCTLTAHVVADGRSQWTTRLPGNGRVLAGVNSALPSVRDISPAYADARRGWPRPVPARLGFPLDGRVQVVDTATGRLVRGWEAPDRQTRGVVVGGQLVLTRAVHTDTGCQYTVLARDPTSDQVTWRKDGYDPHTATSIGCEQGDDPLGENGLLLATGAANRPVLLEAATGRERVTGPPGSVIVATDGRLALLRAADGTAISLIDVDSGRPRWQRAIRAGSELVVTANAVVITDRSEGTISAIDPTSQRDLLAVRSRAQVIGLGPAGLVIGDGRTVAYLSYGDPAR